MSAAEPEPQRMPPALLPQTEAEAAGYKVMKICDLISELAGDTKKAARTALMLAAPVFPIAACLYLQDNVSRWLLVPSATGIILAVRMIAQKTRARSKREERTPRDSVTRSTQ